MKDVTARIEGFFKDCRVKNCLEAVPSISSIPPVKRQKCNRDMQAKELADEVSAKIEYYP